MPMLALLFVCLASVTFGRRVFESPALLPRREHHLNQLLLALSPARIGTKSAQTVMQGRSNRRGTSAVKAMEPGVPESPGDYSEMVKENRMITIEESQIRYAGALVVALLALYDYVGMQTTGNFDYNKIALGFGGAWALFETGRKSIWGCVLALRWNLDKPFSFTEPPAEYEGFMRRKRLESLEIGLPSVNAGAAVATLVAAINSDLSALVPTLQNCFALGAISILVLFLARKSEESTN